MTDYVIEGYYIGILPELDDLDGSGGPENASTLIETSYGDAANPFYTGLVNVTLHDDFVDPEFPSQPLIASDDGDVAPELISLDGISSHLDTSFTVYVEVTLLNGDTITEGRTESSLRMQVVQDQMGRTFLLPSSQGTSEEAIGVAPIESLTIIGTNIPPDGGLTSLAANLPSDAFVCFLPGTLIRTPSGDWPIESLRRGDLVLTLDNGPQVVRWIGSRTISSTQKTAPVRIASGTFVARSPLERSLRLSTVQDVVEFK